MRCSRGEPLPRRRRRGVPSLRQRRWRFPSRASSGRPHMSAPETATGVASKRFRLPGIEREGIAQLSLLETALWPLQGGKLPSNSFETSYSFATHAGRKRAIVTVRAALGMQPIDELVLWGLLGATLSWKDPDPV